MKILYVIVSCLRYQDTRRNWQENTWIKRISPGSNYVYLVGNKSNKSNTFSSIKNKKDGYNDAHFKYYDFITRYDYGQFDWLFFCDDDTYVFDAKLRSMLKEYNHKSNLIIGRVGVVQNKEKGSNIFTRYPIKFCSGGAGFAVSLPVMFHLKTYLRANRIYPVAPGGDTSFASWVKKVNLTNCIINKGNVFQCQHPRAVELDGITIDDIVTYHWCTEEDFKNLDLNN